MFFFSYFFSKNFLLFSKMAHSHEKWISIIPLHKLSPFITMNERDLEMLKEFDPEGYNYATTNREKLIVKNFIFIFQFFSNILKK